MKRYRWPNGVEMFDNGAPVLGKLIGIPVGGSARGATRNPWGTPFGVAKQVARACLSRVLAAYHALLALWSGFIWGPEP
jgi:hypothetical protein